MSATGWIVLGVGIVAAIIIAVVLANRNQISSGLTGEKTEEGRSLLQSIFSLAGADKETSGTVGDVGDIFNRLTART